MQDPEVLKATTAHEIDRAEITEAETLVFEGRVLSQTGRLTMNPGEFYFRPNAVPFEDQAPKSFFTRLFWRLRGKKAKHGFKFVSTIIIACPFCAQPILTTFSHIIINRSPLTIDQRIACPYSKAESTHAFSIKDGNIMPA